MPTEKDARRSNVLAAISLASVLESSLGPRGMDKMLVREVESDKLVLTNDGARILEVLEVKNPAAKALGEIGKAQGSTVGDGTKTAVVLAGYLLTNALRLLDDGLKPAVILEGYDLALEKLAGFVDKLYPKVELDREVLRRIALTAIHGKGVCFGDEGVLLADIVVEAGLCAVREANGRRRVERDDVAIEVYSSGTILESRLIKGVMTKPAYEQEKLSSNIPRRMSPAKIALLNCPLEVEKTTIRHELIVETPDQLSRIYDAQEAALERIIDKIKNSGANVVLNGRRVDPLPQYYLGKQGIMLVRNISVSDVSKLAKATGAKICNSWRDLEPSDIGGAELVEWRRLTPEAEWRLFVEGCTNPQACTILALGSSVHVKDALDDAMSATAAIVEDGRYVGGGGAFEMGAARRLRQYARKVGRIEQMAIEAFAESLEAIPKAIASNAGMNWLDVLPELRAGHSGAELWYGIDALERRLTDTRKVGILDPFEVKIHAINSAVEATRLIFRVDRLIKAK